MAHNIKINPKYSEYTVIFLIFFENGARKNDLQQIKMCDMDADQLRIYIKGFLATPSNPKHLMKNRIALKKYFMNSISELKAFVEGEVNEEIKKPTPKKKAVKKTDSEDK
jgi:hypothetical protein